MAEDERPGIRCDRCDGTGEVRTKRHPDDPSYMVSIWKCSWCRGTGRLKEEEQ